MEKGPAPSQARREVGCEGLDFLTACEARQRTPTTASLEDLAESDRQQLQTLTFRDLCVGQESRPRQPFPSRRTGSRACSGSRYSWTDV